jgi:cytochrome c-type biogenesis protein CcmH
MNLWFPLALMTAAACFAVLWPLGRSKAGRAAGQESEVYRDQLAEIVRDRDAGLIPADQAEAARVEVARRLLGAAEHEAQPVSVHRPARRVAAVVTLIGLPLIAGVMYARTGTPGQPDMPLAERAQLPATSQSLDNLVQQVEAHLAKNPTDGRGWDVLAPVLFKLGRFDEAVRALRNAIANNSETAARRADLGEALSAAAGGVVTADAKSEFERALVQDKNDVKARYYIALAAEQDGRADDAAEQWRAMLASAPANAPWRPLVQSALSRVGGPEPAKAPALSDDQIDAVKGMNAADQQAMIRGMVDGLAAKLKQDGSDPNSWLRLIRAYIVLGERDKAELALDEARAAVPDAEKLRVVNEGARSLGFN